MPMEQLDDDLDQENELNTDLDDNQDDDNLEDDESHEDGSDSGDEDDTRLTSGDDDDESDAEREAIRERRRQERRSKKQAVREREDSFRRQIDSQARQIAELSNQLNAIHQRNSGFDQAQIDNQMRQLQQAYEIEKQRINEGVANGDGASVTDATERMMAIRENYNRLDMVKRQGQRAQAAPPATSPDVMSRAQKWHQNNRWYNPNGSDIDSQVVLLIDRQMATENWNPATDEYWVELDKRVKKQLPSRFPAPIIQDKRASKKNSPIGGSSRDGGGNGSKPRSPRSTGEYHLSAARVQAIKDAGLWDDPEKRKAAIANYKKFDDQKGE